MLDPGRTLVPAVLSRELGTLVAILDVLDDLPVLDGAPVVGNGGGGIDGGGVGGGGLLFAATPLTPSLESILCGGVVRPSPLGLIARAGASKDDKLPASGLPLKTGDAAPLTSGLCWLWRPVPFVCARRVTSAWNASRSVRVLAASVSSFATVSLYCSSSLAAPSRCCTWSSSRSRSVWLSSSAFSSVLSASCDSCSSRDESETTSRWLATTASWLAVAVANCSRSELWSALVRDATSRAAEWSSPSASCRSARSR